jgi:purine-cytosine permease-like protein
MSEDKSVDNKLAVEVLLRYYEEQWEQIRHLENQRATFINIVIVVSVGIVGFVMQQGLGPASIPLAVMLVVLGVYGSIASQKFYERYGLHRRHAEKWLGQINHLVPNARLTALHKEAQKEHESKYRILSKIHVHIVWLTFNLLITIIGIGLTLYSLDLIK